MLIKPALFATEPPPVSGGAVPDITQRVVLRKFEAAELGRPATPTGYRRRFRYFAQSGPAGVYFDLFSKKQACTWSP